MPLNLEPVQSGYNLSVINENFQRIEDTWDEKLDRLVSSQPNYMEQALDMNSNPILNTLVSDDPSSLVTREFVESLIIGGQYLAPIPYAADINFAQGEVTKTIDRDGIIYAPLPSAIPFTTTGTWVGDDEDKFFVLQGVTITSLPLFTNLAFNSVRDMVAHATFVEGYTFTTNSYIESTSGTLQGGGEFKYVDSLPKAWHNGGTIISPTVPFDGNVSSIPDFLDGVGETDPSGTGVLVRVLGDYETPEMYGAQRDGITDDIFSISKCDATCPSRHIKYTSGTYAIGVHPDHPEGFAPARDRTTHEGVGFSWTSETGLTVLKYIGPVNDTFAVMKLSRANIGEDTTQARNYTVRNIKLDGNAKAGFGMYQNYANNDSSVENIVIVNTRYRGMHIVKSWYNNMRDVVCYNNYGAGMMFGIPLFDLIPASTERLDVNAFNIVNPRAHSNGRQLPDETLAQWEARRFNESTRTIQNCGIGIGFVHGFTQINPVSEFNYGVGIFRTDAQGADTRGLVSYGGYVERNCDEAVDDGESTNYWEVWHDGNGSSTRGEEIHGLWFNPSLSGLRGAVKIAGTPSSSNRNELIRFSKCANIFIPSPEHQQFGNDSDSGGANMPDPFTLQSQTMGLSGTAMTLRDARDGSSLQFATLRYDASSGSDNERAVEVLPRGNANIGLRISRNATTGGEDGRSNLGSAALRWDEVFAVNGAINTSDRNEKTDFTALNEAFIPVLCDIANSIQQWKWKTAMESKGQDARWHIGPIAQEVYEKFAAIGIDAFDYGFVGKDLITESCKVGEKENEDGSVSPIYETKPVLDEHGNQKEIWNLRHNELQYAILWAQQQKINKL